MSLQCRKSRPEKVILYPQFHSDCTGNRDFSQVSLAFPFCYDAPASIVGLPIDPFNLQLFDDALLL